jgi:hypothetical protein
VKADTAMQTNQKKDLNQMNDIKAIPTTGGGGP